MTEQAPGSSRVVAWAREMRVVHDRLREAIDVAREELSGGGTPSLDVTDPLVYCWGFCSALQGHHTAEDAVLFPALLDQRPDLAPVVERLVQDHAMIESLVLELQGALRADASATSVLGHLEGIGAIMESHFRYEERALLDVLEGFAGLEGPPDRVLGPLAG